MISLAELDSDTLKASLIAFMQTQPIFKDYVYTGSNINVLLELLAKNSSLNAFLLNMVASEAFLDSAQIRDSVVSKAKELNYTPRSWRSAEALLNVSVVTANTPATTVTIPSGTTFNTRVDNQVFTFSTASSISTVPSSYIPSSNSYVYSFSSVPVYEGQPITETFLVDNTLENQRFILSNQQIDTDSLAVTVTASNTATTSVTYSKADTLLGLDENSTVYFVQAADNSQYEIVFGDGVLGTAPTTGNIISVSYRVTAGEDANGADTFTLVGPSIGGYQTYTIATADVARGGAEEETIDSIRYNAPRHYQTQERAISFPDYVNLIRENFPEVRAIHVYGGEDVTPPRYGFVLISVDLQNFDGIPEVKKTAITSFIQPKMSPSVKAEVIEPDFTYIQVNAAVEYSTALTTNNVEDIQTSITNAVQNYSDTELDDFDVTFRYAVLGDVVNKADPSITSTDVSITLFKLIQPTANITFTQALNFQNALTPGTITSTPFTFNSVSANFYDKGDGQLYVAAPGSTVQLSAAIGTIDYVNGIVKVSTLLVSDFVGESIKVSASTVKQDVRAQQNTIVTIGMGDSLINVTPAGS